jgi:hypothetical protein
MPRYLAYLTVAWLILAVVIVGYGFVRLLARL